MGELRVCSVPQPPHTNMSTSEIKLTYFDARGRAETSRLILAYAGVRYVDQRLTGEQFSTVKEKLPFGQLPALKYNGQTICQSMAIARFLAKEYDLVGLTAIETAQADEIVDRINDILEARVQAVFATDESKKTELMRTLLEETVPAGLAQLETRIQERGGQFLVGNQLTWADFHLFSFADFLDGEALESYPGLANLASRIAELPNIVKWMASRPSTVL